MNTPRRRHQPRENARPLDREIYKVELIRRDTAGFALVELQATMRLDELAAMIQAPGGLDGPYTVIFTEGDRQERFGTFDADPSTMLAGFGLGPGSQFVVELGGVKIEAHVLAVEDATDVGGPYPRFQEWKLDGVKPAPGALIAGALPPELTGLAAEIRASLEQELGPDEPNPYLDQDLALIERFIDGLKGRAELIAPFCVALGPEIDLLDWSWEVAHDLRERGRHQETLALLERMESVPELFPEVRPLRAQVFIEQGRADEARSLTEAMISESERPEREFLAGRALQLLIGLGELKRAEELAYRVRRHDDIDLQCDAVEALADIYRRTGRKQQARKLERELEKLERIAEEEEVGEWWGDDDEGSGEINPETVLRMAEGIGLDLGALGITPEQIADGSALAAIEKVMQARPDLAPAPQAEAPARATQGVKVGRNEPCPCGSGKKYKKCCGA